MKTTNQNIKHILAKLEAEERAAEASQTFKGHTVADLRKVFEKVQNPQDWKAPWAAAVPHQIVGVVLAAVEFFHADRATVVGTQPITGKVLLRGNGYRG